MSKKQAGLLVLLAAIALAPALAGAESREAAPNKRITKERAIREDKREAKRDLRDATSTATSTKERNPRATSTPERRGEDKRADVEKFLGLAARKVQQEIKVLRNLLARLSGPNSIVAKLDQAGQNTAAIKAKLSDAKNLTDKAQAELDAVRNATSTAATASSTPTAAKNRMLAARAAYAKASQDVKLATAKVKEARRLIAQIPGLARIEATEATSTVPAATSTSATTTASSTR